jgi:hypothetical protein
MAGFVPLALCDDGVRRSCSHSRAKHHEGSHEGVVAKKFRQVKSSQVKSSLTTLLNMTKLVQNPCKLQRTCTENPQKNVGYFVRFKFNVLDWLSENCRLCARVSLCVPYVCPGSPRCLRRIPRSFESTQDTQSHSHSHIHIHVCPPPVLLNRTFLFRILGESANVSITALSSIGECCEMRRKRDRSPQESARARPFVESSVGSGPKTRCARACCKSRGAVSPSSARGSGFTFKVIQRWRRAQAAPAAQVCSVRSFGLG